MIEGNGQDIVVLTTTCNADTQPVLSRFVSMDTNSVLSLSIYKEGNNQVENQRFPKYLQEDSLSIWYSMVSCENTSPTEITDASSLVPSLYSTQALTTDSAWMVVLKHVGNNPILADLYSVTRSPSGVRLTNTVNQDVNTDAGVQLILDAACGSRSPFLSI